MSWYAMPESVETHTYWQKPRLTNAKGVMPIRIVSTRLLRTVFGVKHQLQRCKRRGRPDVRKGIVCQPLNVMTNTNIVQFVSVSWLACSFAYLATNLAIQPSHNNNLYMYISVSILAQAILAQGRFGDRRCRDLIPIQLIYNGRRRIWVAACGGRIPRAHLGNPNGGNAERAIS